VPSCLCDFYMSKRLFGSRIDAHLIAVTIIVTIAVWPLITRPGLPRHTDLELHVFRAAEFERLLAARPLEYPRWAPNLYYGYGYPIFNYYAPLTYFATSAFAAIPGVTIVDGMKLVLLATFALAGYGAFFLARRHLDAAGGVVVSAAYVLSPYIVFIDPWLRGDAAEFLSLGWLPWLFLAFDRPLRTRRAVACAAGVMAAFVFSHNLLAIIGAALVVAWLVWRGLWLDGARRWLRDAAAFVLALGVTAIFWLPFVAERDAVRLEVTGPGHFDYRAHFVEVETLLRPSPALDLGATTPHFIYNLGLPQWLLATPVLLALRRRSERRERAILFFAVASLILIFLVTPASALVWEVFPAAAIIQFPWRLLGPCALMLSMCVGYGATSLVSHRLAPAAVVSVVAAFALPTLYPPAWEADFGDVSPRGMIDFELSGVALGTTSTGDFLPHTVSMLPPPDPALIRAYQAGQVVDRFDYAEAAGASVRALRLGDLEAEYSVESASEFTARFFLFAFPGWQAYVDGHPVALSAIRADGLIRFDVPASARSFALRFESTLPRALGSTASLMALIAIVVMSMPLRGASPLLPSSLPGHSAGALVVFPVAFLIVKVLAFDPCDTCFRYTSPPGEAQAASVHQRATLGGHIELLGFDLPRPVVESGQVVPLTLYWRANAPVTINYQVFAHLTRPASVLWGQSDKLNPGDFPSTRWPLDKYVWDDHRLRVLPGTPPGDYALVVGLYTLADGRRAPVLDAAGNVVGDSVQLSLPVRVARPSGPLSTSLLDIQISLNARQGDLALLGASIERTSLTRPDLARITLFWQAMKDSPMSTNVRVQMLDAQGALANEIAAEPTGGLYPTSQWRSGEIVRDVFALWLPPGFPVGRYSVQIVLENGAAGMRQSLSIGGIEVTDE